MEHAKKMEAEFVTAEVKGISADGDVKKISTDKGDYEAKTVILATGADHRKLGVPGEQELGGMGVSYCATCDGAFFRGKTVAVAGGGDVALEDALFLARGCSKVYLIHRRDEFRGAKVLQEQVKKTENIELVLDTVIEEIKGEGQVQSIDISNKKTKEKRSLPVDGVFIAVGTMPNTESFSGLVKWMMPDTLSREKIQRRADRGSLRQEILEQSRSDRSSPRRRTERTRSPQWKSICMDYKEKYSRITRLTVGKPFAIITM